MDDPGGLNARVKSSAVRDIAGVSAKIPDEKTLLTIAISSA
jgi:hypothetical protein